MPTSGAGTNVNGGGPRTSNRRRDSQRPGDIAGRQNRNGKTGQQEGLDRRLQKRKPEPYGTGVPQIYTSLSVAKIANILLGTLQ